MRFDDRVTGNVRTYAPYARIVHVDIDPAEIGKNVAVEVPIVGDAKRVLAALTPMVEAVAAGPAARLPRAARRVAARIGGDARGTAPARGATGSSRPTTSSSGSAS